MNPLLARLQPYPFERLRALTAGIVPSPAHRPISLGIGEPRHATPALIEQALVAGLKGLSSYPATAGEPRLREAIAGWLQRRYGVALDAATQVLPVNGSREALFALAQTVIDPTRRGATVVCPNPFYQIYEGAALLAGAQTAFANSDPSRNFAADWSQIDAATWARTQLLYVCSPGNPTGAVMPLDEWRALFELSDRHGFVIASDECYSEIYFRDEPPLGALQAARLLGRDDFRRLVVLSSLSKRSNVPGMRSGFVAGDAAVLKNFLLYRTYHGSAMSPVVQAASIAGFIAPSSRRSRRCSPACSTWPCPTRGSTCGPPCPGVAKTSAQAVSGTMSRSPSACWLNTMWRSFRAACSRATPTARTPAAAASAWHWWPASTNASKPPSASSPSPEPCHDTSTADHHRPRLGCARQPRQRQHARAARRGRPRHRRPQQGPHPRGRAPGRRPVDSEPVGQEGGAAEFPAQ
jgi:N-succinyldiaminopimelate aminotransferase